MTRDLKRVATRQPMRWTNDKRHYIRAHHHEPDNADITPGDVLASLALVVLVLVTFAGCVVWGRAVL